MNLSVEQLKQLNKLWFIYGNNGKKHSHLNHKWIQGFLERNEDSREFYLNAPKNWLDNGLPEDKIKKDTLTQECIDEVDKILNDK